MSQPSINIVAAESVGDYRLRLLFDDGMEQTVDFKPFLTHAHHPDLRSYLDPAQFSTFRIEYGDLRDVRLFRGERRAGGCGMAM